MKMMFQTAYISEHVQQDCVLEDQRRARNCTNEDEVNFDDKKA